jgi:hypothetical protein
MERVEINEKLDELVPPKVSRVDISSSGASLCKFTHQVMAQNFRHIKK